MCWCRAAMFVVLDSADRAGVPFGHQAEPVSARQENCRQGCHLDAEDSLDRGLHKPAGCLR
jgi:hypothetical protein